MPRQQRQRYCQQCHRNTWHWNPKQEANRKPARSPQPLPDITNSLALPDLLNVYLLPAATIVAQRVQPEPHDIYDMALPIFGQPPRFG